MAFRTQQSEGFPDVVMKVEFGSAVKIPNGQRVTVLAEAGHDNYQIEWKGTRGSVKKTNIQAQLPESVITSNPNRKFKEVFLWREGNKHGVPNGTSLPVVGLDINRRGFFYVVKYREQDYSVKQDNVEIEGDLAPVDDEDGPVDTASIPPGGGRPKPKGRGKGHHHDHGHHEHHKSHHGDGHGGGHGGDGKPAADPDTAAAHAAALEVVAPTTPGDIFACCQVTQANEKLLSEIIGDRTLKASMPFFNRKGSYLY